VRFGGSRSSKVDDFGTNRKRVCDFLLVNHCTVSEINCLFFLPHSHSAPSLSMFPLEFRGDVYREETRVMGPRFERKLRSERSARFEPNVRSERVRYFSERETNVQAFKRLMSL